jgi:hypothetical protein
MPLRCGQMLSGILGGLGAVLVLTLLMRAGRRAAATVDVSTGARSARYPTAARFLAWVLLVTTLGLSGFAFTKIPTTRGMVIGALICSAAIAAMTCLVLEFTRIRASWTPKQVELSSPWTGKRKLDWSDLTEVQFSQSMNWFVLRGRPGTVVRLSGLLGGLTELLRALREQAPPALLWQIDEAVSAWQKRSR